MADKPKKKPSKSSSLPKASRAAGQKTGANPSGARPAVRPPPPRRAGR